MCVGNADMRWQFGGNFQPVRTICEENWKECPIAVLNYIWSEVVTEVVDCLSNDALIWRVIAMMVVLIMLVHTVYYKLRWVDETSVNKENLNKVGFKVQDLELKVNILTYKMQYGTWPLPHLIRQSGMGNELHNVRLTLSNSEDRNTWIKHLLLSPRKNKDSLYNKILPHSVKCTTNLTNLETKYVSSQYQNDVLPNESGDKTIKNNSQNATRKWKRCKKCFDITLSKQRQTSKSENLGLRRPKSIFLLKKEKTDSQVTNKLESNETFVVKKDSQSTEKIESSGDIELQSQNKEQSSELSENYSESTHTGSEKNIFEEMQLERNSTDLSQESDTHHKTEKRSEGRLEKADDPKMEKLRTENDLQLYKEDINSINEIHESGKSTDETFYSWEENDTLENTPRNERPNLLPPSLSITFLTDTFPKNSSFGKSTISTNGDSNQHSFTSTYETLHQVRGELESLHNVLLAYESKEGNQTEGSCILQDYLLYKDAKSEKSSKVSFNFDLKKRLITDDETLNSSEYEQCESIIESSSTSLSVQSYSNMFSIHREVLLHKPKYNRFDITDSSSEDEKYKFENSSSASINTFKIEFDSREDLSELKSISRLNSDLALKSYNVNLNIDRITTSQHNPNYIRDKKIEIYPMDTSDDQISRSSSQIEFLTEENSDNQSTSALLQEALQFKDALLSQMELEKELKICPKTINKDEEYDFRKNTWPKVDNYFQTKILDIITEEQSASSSTEKTSKTLIMRQMEENNFSHQQNNFKSALGSTSSEYFSFSNLSQKESEVPRESEITSEKENENEIGSEVPLSNNKRGLDSEIRPNDLVKRSKYMTQEEEEENLNEEKKNKNDNDKKILWSSNLIANSKEVEEKNIREANKIELKNYDQDSHLQEVEDQNSNILSLMPDSSSNESLTQFIRELMSNKAKAAKIFRESKLNLNSTKSEDKSSTIEIKEEKENTFTLQRSPGSFSLTEDQSREKSFKTFDSDSHSHFESANSEEELEFLADCPQPKIISGEIESKENKEKIEIVEMEDQVNQNIDINKNKNMKSVNSKNIESRSNFNLSDLECSPPSLKTVTDKLLCENLKEESIKEEKNQEFIQVSDARSESGLQKLVENKIEYSLKDEISRNLDSQEKIDKSQSNLTSEPSSSLYFTAGPSTSDIKLNSKNLISSNSVSKFNTEIQETFVENLNESFSEKGICENDRIKIEKPKVSEAMLIDLSDDIPAEKSSNKNSETCRTISTNGNEISKFVDLNILDADFTEKIEQHFCLIPKKIDPKNEAENNFDDSEAGSYVKSKDQDFMSLTGISFFENSNIQPNKTKITEINKFPHSSSAPSLQRFPWKARMNSIQSLSSVRSKPNLEVDEKSRTLLRRSGSREKSKENFENSEKLNENSNKGKQTGKQSTGDHNQRKSRSLVSPRLSQSSSKNSNSFQYEESIKSVKDQTEVDQQHILSSKTSIKSGESQKSSKSCIPILKTRLENIKKTEHKSRHRSPNRGPLTISPRNDARDLKEAKQFKTIKKEANREKNDDNEKSFGDNTDAANNLLKDVCPEPNEKTVIYVNIITDQDESKRKVMDPKKFLQYVKNRELKFQNINNEDKREDLKPNILTVLSSVIENDLPMRNQNKFSFQVEQQEQEVSAKPSVMDNSTSVSDFHEFCDVGKQNRSKFQIFQVPEELTKEEYINLLDTLNQDPNLEQLKKMHSLCRKLGLGFQE